MSALWFLDHGVHVFPAHGKEPAVPKGTSWKDYRCTREQAARLRDYGVPLSPTLGALDTDNRDDEVWVLQQIARRAIPDTPFLVETARGFHRYFRLAGALPKFIHRDGHTLEFRNEGQYVVGPGSMHPRGGTYAALYWSWRWEDIPFFPADFVFDDRPLEARGAADGEPFEFPEIVRAGERHDQLFRLLRSCKGRGWDLETTREAVLTANQLRCSPPLAEDDAFDRWFARQWNKPDRPFDPPATPLRGLGGVQGV